MAKLSRLFGALAILALGAGIAPAQSSARAGDDSTSAVDSVVRYLAAHAVPLTSLEAGHRFNDLAPLAKILQGVRVVGVGEATHGTHEFFTVKHRLLEFLVEEMGFNAFGLEASMPACMAINDYVVHGIGDPAKALASQGFWTWDTEEVRDMIAWARQYNSRLPEAKRIRFLGYDMQRGYDIAVVAIREYLRRVAPDALATAEGAFPPMVEPGSNNQPAIALMSQEEQARAIEKLETLHAFMRDHRAEFLKRSSDWDYGIALLYTRVLVQGARMHADFGALLRAQPDQPRPRPRFTEGNYRDRMMAENVEAQLQLLGPNARMMIWAHNMHVAVETNYGGGLTLGYHLRQSLGAEYYAIGLTFNEGSFQIIDLKRGLVEFTVPPAPAGSLPWAFASARVGKPYRDYFVDFRPIARTSAVRRWLDAPQLQYYVGSGFSNPTAPRYLIPSAVGQQYDGMIFIAKTTRARPNPTGQRPPP